MITPEPTLTVITPEPTLTVITPEPASNALNIGLLVGVIAAVAALITGLATVTLTACCLFKKKQMESAMAQR